MITEASDKASEPRIHSSTRTMSQCNKGRTRDIDSTVLNAVLSGTPFALFNYEEKQKKKMKNT